MFKKLKKKFILINLCLLTAVFIGIFGTIFGITVANLNREIDMTLQATIRDNKPIGGKQPMKFGSISVDLDSNGNIIRAVTLLDIDETTVDELVKVALITSDKSKTIKVAGTNYAFLKQSSNYGTKIVFLDKSDYETVLFQLLETFVFVGALSLIILLAISIYLTNKSIEPIKATFEKQKQFIADASHELKTPLAIIRTNTSLVLSNPEDSIKNQSKWLNYISSQTDRMSELINEMLSLAKLDVEENKINFIPVNLSKTVESMILGFEAILFENGILLDTNIEKNISINGDEESIKKLFSIIMDNAVKYTNKNGKVSVTLAQDKNKIRLKILNTGEGISSEHLEKIFERFYRVDSSRVRETGGYGLGLSIAKSIVEQHKGKIYAESNVGEDTTFVIELPYTQGK